MSDTIEWNGRALDLRYERRSADRLDFDSGPDHHAVGVRHCDDGVIELTFGPRRARVHVRRTGDDLWLAHDGRSELLRLRPPAPAAAPAAVPGAGVAGAGGGEGLVRAPTAAVVVRCHVGVGAAVAGGDLLVTLEAMKMEIPVRAAHAGVVAALDVAPGDAVASGAVLVRLASCGIARA